MNEKINPSQKTNADEISEDDPIIELTDEVTIEPKEDLKLKSSKTDNYFSSEADRESESRDDEGVIIFEEYTSSSLQNGPYTEGDGQSPEDDSRLGLTDNIKPGSFDEDDLFLMDGDQNKVVGKLTDMMDDDAGEITGDENRHNFDKRTGLEVDIDEDEIEFFSGDEKKVQDSDQMAMFSETSLRFGENDNNKDVLSDIDFERKEGEYSTPLAELDNTDGKTVDDIIEITEFDQHFMDDETIEHAGLLDPSALKDEDFLELFDIEEEDPMEDEEMKELSQSEEKGVEAELSRFYDDALEDDSAAEKIDHPGTPFPKDPKRDKDEYMRTDLAASNPGGSPVVSVDQIDQAIERIINEKLAGRIEHIIYEIIEKAVKREIDQLKESLLDDSTP